MNRVFRIVWSRALHTWVVASELATRHGKAGTQVDRRAGAAGSTADRLASAGQHSLWPLRLSIVAALLALHAPAHAVDRYWDVNGTSLGYGGTGTWNTTNAFWSPNNDGVSGPYSAWNNAALYDAYFGGTAGTVTLGGAMTVHNLTFQTTGYSLTGGSLTLGGTNPTITVTTGSTTIASPITSTSGLITGGAGTLTLNGSNTFGGGITINGGALVLNAANSFTGDINAIGGSLSIGAIGDAALGNAANQIYLANGRSFSSTGMISSSRTANLTGGIASIGGTGVGGVRYTGAGGLSVADGVSLTNNANDYQGQTRFTTQTGWSGSYNAFTSIADLGVASALGAPTTVANGTIVIGPGGGQSLGPNQVYYTGTGNSSNRNWQINPGAYAGSATLFNAGSGTLRLTGNIAAGGAAGHAVGFAAQSADMELLGVISANDARGIAFSASAGRTVRLGIANTFTGPASIGGAGKVEASLIANAGVAGSLGAGSVSISGGNLSYVGAGESTNKNWGISNGSLNSNGAGALSLSGTVGISNTATLGGSFTGADNLISGVISGTGNLRSAGSASWTLTGANTYTGTTIVDSGVLRAGTATAFGASTAAQVNGGTLDFNDFDRSFNTLAGTGGVVDLGTATLTLQAAAGTTASYAGNITGTGGLTKLGASTQTLTGANTYTGATTIGGGVLALDFSPAGGPTSNIVSSSSTLNMVGGRLNIVGAAGESDTQTFNGLNVTASNNTIDAKSGTGGSLTVNLGAINRTGGLINFNLPTSGSITTTNTTLGGWATVNGTDYAKVVGGKITAFAPLDYTNKDNAANWLNNEYITDATGFFGTVTGTKQLAGLRYTVPKSTTVTVSPGQTLGVDGTIIVAPTVANTNQLITGGMMTGASGGDLAVQQNSTGNFTIASQIVDNGTGTGFVKAGTGLVTLSNTGNTYTGATRVAQGTLAVSSIKNGGVASGIGASSAAPSNLALEGATLSYTGTGDTSDRGFTFAKSGAIIESGVQVTNAAANLTFSGLVSSPDGANFLKSGPGTLTLANPANAFTGIVTVSGGLLGATTLADGGQASSIGAGGSASANLVLNGGGLQYTGATASTNRGFTLGSSGGIVDVTAAGTTLTDSGVIVGAGSLTKNGAGTLVLSGANTYTGGNTVNNGILRAGAANALGGFTGSPTNLANTAGVLLDLNNFNNMIGPLNGGGANGGNVTLGSGTLRIVSGNGNYSGVISGTGGVWRTDGGNQTFNGCNNTYTGATNLQGATLTVNCLANGGAASGIGASSSASANLTFTNGNLNYTGGTVSIDRGFNLAGYGVIDVVSGTTLGFSGQVVGGGELYKDNAGTLVLSGNNTYTNNTRVRGGTLRAGSATAFGSTNSFWLDNTAGALLDMNNFNANAGALIGGGAAGGNIAMGTGTLTIRDGLGQTYAGAISGTGSLIKNGAGTQILSGCNNSYTGSTAINAGVLTVNCLNNGGVNSSIGASSAAPANLSINGTLRYVGTGSSTDRQFTLGTSGGTLDASGTGIVEFTSAAPVTLAGANTARTLTLTGSNTGYNLLAAQLDNNGAGVTSLTKTGTGTWRLTNANSTYTGITRINGGVLSVDQMANGGQASSIGASSSAAANLVIGNGSTLRYTGAGDTSDRQFTLDTGVTYIESSGTGALQFTNTGAVALLGTNATRTIALGGTNTGANTMGGAIGDNGTGKTTLAKNDSGTWVLTGNNTYTGNTVINNGNLMIGNGGTTGNAGAGNVIVDSPTSTLSLNRSDTFTFSGTLSGPGTLAQVGSGTSVLTSAANQIGATTISAGTLQVNGGLTTPTIGMTGTSALTVNGTVQAAGPAPAAISGDAGNQSITVNGGGTLLASGDLGDGSDALNLTGQLNTGTGTLSLGNGNDVMTLHDGASIAGTGVDAGAGTDQLVIDNANPYVFSGAGVSGFEQLTKQNGGVLTLTGAQAYSAGTAVQGGTLDVDGTLTTPTLTMADNTLLNVDGTVQAAGAAPATLSGSGGSNTVLINSGGVLRANGSLGDGSDAVTVAGTLDTGASALSLGDGNDVLTLRDGATLAGVGVDGGTGVNQLVLDNAGALSFNGNQTSGFGNLVKQNTGTATMTGTQTFTLGTAINQGTLDVEGNLTTPSISLADGTTLNVDGTVQAAGGNPSVLTGSAGSNTVSVGAGGTLLASGDLGDGSDVLDVAGTLNTGGGTLALGAGNDTLTIHDNTNIIGTVSAGAGNDTFDTHIDTVANLGAVQGFETLAKTGTGVLNINGPLSSDFNAVNVQTGTLNVTAAGSVVGSPGIPLTTTVAAGATLNVDGSYGCSAGDDSMTVAGTVSGSGTIDLCGGNDTLTLQDGAVLNNTISGGTGTGDTLVLDAAGTSTFDASRTSNFELLQKINSGTATLTGTHTFTGGATLSGGTLNVAGTLHTPTVSVAGGTTLQVDGSVDAGTGTPTLISGDAGSNTVSVGSGGLLLATGDLGAGVDTLDVTGTLNTGGGVFSLGDGNDNFVVHDGTTVVGTVDGGAGLDTRTYDINGVATLGALLNFEGVTKTGAGTLNVAGPGATALQEVQVLGGTLNVAAGASIEAAAGSPLTTTVAGGATLNVDGSYGCGAGNDTMNVSGTVSGSGTINLCGGDDTLVLNDGANLAGLAQPIDGDAGTGDKVVLNNAGAMTLDAGRVANFEILQKDNTGEATLTGTQSYTGGTLLNNGTLTVAGQLDTPTVAMADGTVLNVDGQLDGGAGTAAAITGSSGVNTVNVAAGALLVATGDLGDGNDVLSVAGTLQTQGGVFSLGAGDDTFKVFDTTNTAGATIDGGAGNDTLDVNISGGHTAPLGSLLGFESLGKSGQGTLEIQGTSNFIDVNVNQGVLRVSGAGSVSAVNTDILAGATLELANGGSYLGTSGADSFTVAGTVLGSGTINLGDGDDTFTIKDGADLSGLATPVSGGAGNDTFVADLAGQAVLGGAIDFETLSKTNTGTLTVAGPAPSAFTTVHVDGGTLDVGAAGNLSGVVTTTVANGATLQVDGSFSGSAGNDSMTLAGALSGSGSIAFGAGDDVLTLRDGADMSGFTGTLDGGAYGTGNTVMLDNAQALSFGNGTVTNFQFLDKTNSGTATLVGNQNFSGGTTLGGGQLLVNGSLHTPGVAMSDDTTLSITGTLDAGSGTASAITGSAGVNTVAITGTALATGDLGAGNDVLDVRGTLDTAGGVFALGDGDDSFVVHDGTMVQGTVDGGAGFDTRVYDINLAADLGALVNFEGVTKTGTGVLNINGPATTNLQQVNVLGGILNIATGATVAAIAGGPLDTVVAASATLKVDGHFGCGDSADHMTVAGTVAGSGSIDLCGGDDVLTLKDGAVLDNTISGGGHNLGDTVVLDNTGALSFDASRTINFEFLRKDSAGEATLTGSQSFTGGSAINGGTLTVAGQLETPTVALADGTTLNVNGTVQNAGATATVLSGSAGTNTVTVGEGATLRATGDLGAGNDVLDVAGTLDTAGGSLALGDGDDTLTIHDHTRIIGTVAAGAGNDTFNADIATVADLGAVQGFETLSKTGAGVLNVNGPASSDLTAVNVRAGVLDVTAGGSITAQATTVAAGATLQVEGKYGGTSGDDSFTSMGTVRGAFDFGAGNDSVSFVGGDISGVTALHGGGGTDRLSFSGLTLDSAKLPALSGWERMELLDASSLSLSAPLNLGGGTLAIDGSSKLLARTGASFGGSIENAGLIDVGSSRLPISGDYVAKNGTLQLDVSAETLKSGGLDVGGDVSGVTRIAFGSDGSKLSGAGKVSILVISSPHDNPATPGSFVPANTVDGAVRLGGSAFPWSFGQQSDQNWYLQAQSGLLPELPAYAVLPTLGALMARQNDDLVHQRLAGMRSTERPLCGNKPEQRDTEQADTRFIDDCHGFWVAATASSTDLGADPGVATSGSDVGMYVGYDYVGSDSSGTGRIGAFVGYLHGNYWTTGSNSTGLPGIGKAGIRLDTPVAGWYGSLYWNDGSYLDTVVSGQRARARIRTPDGFTQSLSGGSVTVSAKAGHRYRLDSGWTLEPFAKLAATQVHWNSMVDNNQRELIFANHWMGTASTGLRMERVFTTDRGAMIRPWMTLTVLRTLNQATDSLQVVEPGVGGNSMLLPNQDLGTTARLDAGVEARLNTSVSLFGVLSASRELGGSKYREESANVGVRVRW
ncbi:fibronectin-binding autotransporter adhesin [Dyella sp. SG562]|uniref:autotransporter-associated beta strand repeat-containing protein n=1 Tax=Dyella sp. SG562 TaxID=2587017 RepID=UPI00141EAA7D|nr:autotransporter-associated beta strand repeat-containing protein [Dyella sp. SG562]NII73992.1 fibronectin-binding autotransporter adhesin [Dyella sp. SG562]